MPPGRFYDIGVARRQDSSRLVTAAAVGIVLLAAALVGVVITGGRGADDRSAAPTRPPVQERVIERAAHVGGANCDDQRTAEQAGDPATPWCTLDRAAKAAPPGTTVLVAPGRYPVLHLNGTPDRAHLLAFRSADPSRRAVLEGVTANRVRGITFSGFLFVGDAEIRSSQDVRIEDNGFAGHIIYTRQSQRVRIIGNRVRHIRGEQRAFLAQGYGKPGARSTEDLEVRGNLFDDIDHDAIAVYNGYRDVVIADNVISRVHQPEGFRYHSDAMQFMGGVGMTVRGNVIRNVSHGILFKDGPPSEDLRVEGNLVTGTMGAGLQVFNAPGAVIDGNTVWGVRYGLIIGNKDPAAASMTLTDNVLQSYQLLVGEPPRARRNVFGRNPTVGAQAVQGSPKFVDPRRGDFRIRSSDPGAGLSRDATPPGAQLSAAR